MPIDYKQLSEYSGLPVDQLRGKLSNIDLEKADIDDILRIEEM